MSIADELKIFIQKKQKQYLIILFLIVGIISTYHQYSNGQTEKEPSESLDTFIPAGFVLVPIELQNAESISGMIQSHAIIDLYTAPLPGQSKGKLVGRKLRLVRAPLNPERFGVLVPEAESATVAGESGFFVAHIQSKNQNDPAVLSKQARTISRVQYLK
jgi:hypothetical protein